MEWEIAKFAVVAAAFTVLMIFGVGFIGTFLGGIIAEAFREPERPNTPELSDEEHKRRLRERYQNERPIWGVRWLYVLEWSLSLSLIVVFAVATVRLGQALYYGKSTLVIIGIATMLPTILFPKVNWSFVFWRTFREIALILGWILSLTYCTAYFASGDMRGVWAFGILMGVTMCLALQDLFRFIDQSYVKFEQASNRARGALGAYINRQPKYQALTMRIASKKS